MWVEKAHLNPHAYLIAQGKLVFDKIQISLFRPYIDKLRTRVHKVQKVHKNNPHINLF